VTALDFVIERFERGIQKRKAIVEDVDTDKSEILVKAAPYGIMSDIGGGIDEQFEPGTFARAAKAPERLYLTHDHDGPLVGRGLEVDDRADGVWMRARLAPTTAAKDMVALIEAGMLHDCSVEFRTMREHMTVTRMGERLRIVHRRAQLLGVAVVNEAAHQEAYVASVREAELERKAEEARLWLEAYRTASV
jgi:HK97 family phage prohead protease